jgi:hypothetical protein
VELAKAVASLALILGVVLAVGHARGTEGEGSPLLAKETQREAARRAALDEHHKRRLEFSRLCAKPLKSSVELDACRAAYRRL